MEKKSKKSLSSREVVTRDLRIFVSDERINERKEIRRSRITNFRDDRPLFNNNKAFTLIELLVVVLIIGILAAVALPQYQKAVVQARATQVVTLSKSIAEAQQAYHLTNGNYTVNLEELPVDFAGVSMTTDGGWYRSYQITDKAGCTLKGASVQCGITDLISLIRQYDQPNAINTCCAYPSTSYAVDTYCKKLTGAESWTYGGGGELNPIHCWVQE